MTTPRVTVPVEPTEAMKIAGVHAIDNVQPNDVSMWVTACWSAMLSAAPAPEGVAVDVESGAARTAIVNVVERYVTGWGGEFADNPYDAAPHLARELLAALATREEAPAEAGERIVGTIAHVSNGRSELPELIASALRAQPPARAWGWDYEICTGCSASLTVEEIAASGKVSCCPDRRMVTVRDLVDAYDAQRKPPAREDAQPVAVESLEWAIAEIKGDTRYANEDQREAALEKAQSTLAALQAEQGAK